VLHDHYSFKVQVLGKTIASAITVILLVASFYALKPVWAVAADSWVSKAPMQTARAGVGVVVVDGKIYAIGGATQTLKDGIPFASMGGSGAVGTNEMYNPEKDMWVFKASMPTPRFSFGIAVYQNKIYCIGGISNNGSTQVNEVYNTQTNIWETKASLPISGFSLQANVANGKIYAMGGNPTDGQLTYAIYDPFNDSWTTKTPLASFLFRWTSTELDDKIYVLGGLDLYASGSPSNKIYNTATDTWNISTGTYVPLSIFGGEAAATTGVHAPKRIYLIGPLPAPQSALPLFPNQIYDPEKNKWTFAAAMPTGRSDFGLAVVDDVIYAVGGYIYSLDRFGGPSTPVTPSAVNEEYTPIGYSPPSATSFPSPTSSPSLIPSPTGSITSPSTLSPSATQQPSFSRSASPAGDNSNSIMITYWIVGVIAVVAIVFVTAFMLRRRSSRRAYSG
jgi:N-acetylneuraminic acid mutarotase